MVPSRTLYDVPSSHNTKRYRQTTDDRQTDRTSYHKRGRTTQYGRLKMCSVITNHFSISFPSHHVMLFAENDKTYSTPVCSRVLALAIYDSDKFHELICRLTAAHIILVNGSVSLLDFCDAAASVLSSVFTTRAQLSLGLADRTHDFCDAAALILSSVFTKTTGSICRRHVVQNDNCSYNCKVK